MYAINPIVFSQCKKKMSCTRIDYKNKSDVSFMIEWIRKYILFDQKPKMLRAFLSSYKLHYITSNLPMVKDALKKGLYVKKSKTLKLHMMHLLP